MYIPVPERYVETFESIVASSRATMQEKGALPTFVIMGRFNGERTELMPIGGLSNFSPPLANLMVRELASAERPDFLVSVAEVWGKVVHSKEEADRLLREHPRVVDMPEKHSAVYFSLDTYEGAWSAFVPRDGEPGHYTFGEVVLRSIETGFSMFVGLLPQRETDTLQ